MWSFFFVIYDVNNFVPVPVFIALVGTPTVEYFTRSKCDENFLPHYDILCNYDKFVRNGHVVFLLRFFSKVP